MYVLSVYCTCITSQDRYSQLSEAKSRYKILDFEGITGVRKEDKAPRIENNLAAIFTTNHAKSTETSFSSFSVEEI